MCGRTRCANYSRVLAPASAGWRDDQPRIYDAVDSSQCPAGDPEPVCSGRNAGHGRYPFGTRNTASWGRAPLARYSGSSPSSEPRNTMRARSFDNSGSGLTSL
jgi:hypothetical protein